jgi:hypothetical protein
LWPSRYVHDDVTIRNVAVHRYDAISVVLFDPNPLSGDPSWDIAPVANNVALNELRGESAPSEALTRDRELLARFWTSYAGDVGEESQLTAELVQGVPQAEHRQDRLNQADTDPGDVEVTHEHFAQPASTRYDPALPPLSPPGADIAR